MTCLICIEERERQCSHSRATDLDVIQLIELEHGLVAIQASNDAVIAKVHNAVGNFVHDVYDVPHFWTILDLVDGIADLMSEDFVVDGLMLGMKE
jgi:hypothetical protein